ncbi:MAG: pentapeptide repeat-containing protein [Cyanobacteria bacterium P01_G01_bin.54]
MRLLSGFWQFLNTDIKRLPWGELAEQGIDTVTTIKDFADVFGEQAPNLEPLKQHLPKVQPFLDLLNAPVTQLVTAGLPFVSIGMGLLKLYLEYSKEEPTYESAVTVAAQLAYLQSLEVVLTKISDAAINEKLEQVSLQQLVEKQLQRLDELELSSAEAKTVTSRFRESVLAEQFNEALRLQLGQVGLAKAAAQRLVNQVMWGTHRYLHQAIAEAGEAVEPLAEVYRTGGQAVQERYDSIDAYLHEQIAPLPEGQVFDETKIRFRDIYVPLEVQPLTQAGEVDQEAKPINIHDWALGMLTKTDETRKVMFVQGEAGRGKSVFCRMFADLVRQELEFAYIPLLIRLRNIRTLANNFTETLEDCPDLEQVSFVRGDSDWLADRNTRYLIILDGFDELLLEGRATGGLKEFLQQVADFQVRSHHQCLVTGRPLALQGIDRLITQTKGLERVRLEPMSDVLREQWLLNWQDSFGEAEVTQFREFIEACPEEITDSLAREPLLLYLLARLHREGKLTREMFAGATQQIQAKLRVYRESVNWVLEKQREDENLRLAGLEDLDDLREVLQEAALCVVQSGNETARLEMLKSRFQDTANPVAKLLKEARETTGQSEDKALNNLLTTFYLKPGEGDKRGSVEFAHKSFGEYLFAERLKRAFEDWVELDRRKRPRLDERALNGQIYDLLGHSGFTVEVVEYLFELLAESEIDRVLLFNRLHEFYKRWCEGEFLDQPPNENLPQKKLFQLREQGVATGLKQVDVFTGLNVMIVLFKLHAAAQPEGYPFLPEDAPKPEISFHPCGEWGTEQFDRNRLLKIIHYADSLDLSIFIKHVGLQLTHADLKDANFRSAYLKNADLRSANLYRADFYSVYLRNVNFRNADLRSVNFRNADLNGANLGNADVRNALLFRTDLRNVIGLTPAQLTPENPPLLCGALLSPELAYNPDRDWERLPAFLYKRYPEVFETLKEAEVYVNDRRPSQEH